MKEQPMDRGNLGERVRAVRKARDLSQEALAREAGVSLNLVNKLERGVVTDPHFSTLLGIARALGVPVEELMREPVPLGETPSPAGPAVVSVGATPEEAAEKLEQQLYAPARIAQGWHQLAQLFSDELEKVEKGDSEPSSLEILIDTLENVALGMEANVAAEKKELRARYDDEDAVRSKAVLRPAIDRLSALIGEAQQKIDRGELEVKAESEGTLTHLMHSFKRAS
jgi:transcriptional regulator with XRE-family HTH domain